jgi:hypothetical protein
MNNPSDSITVNVEELPQEPMEDKIHFIRETIENRVKGGEKIYEDNEIESRFVNEYVKKEKVADDIIKELRYVYLVRNELNPKETNTEIKDRLISLKCDANALYKHYIIVNKIEMIRRQIEINETDEQIKERLISKNGDVMEVLRDYMGIERKDETPNKSISTNQMIYKEMRTFLDGTKRR